MSGRLPSTRSLGSSARSPRTRSTSSVAPRPFRFCCVEESRSPDLLPVACSRPVIAESGSRPKKRSRGAPTAGASAAEQGKGVFRLAETVPEGWQEKEGGEALRVRPCKRLAPCEASLTG